MVFQYYFGKFCPFYFSKLVLCFVRDFSIQNNSGILNTKETNKQKRNVRVKGLLIALSERRLNQ